MKNIIKELESKVIVSCQASQGEPFYNPVCLSAMMQSAINGGAGGLRLAGADNIKLAKKITDLPVIGITKPEPLPVNWKEIAYITVTLDDAKGLAEAGADIIAVDGTARKRSKENLAEILEKIKTDFNCLAMADVSTLEEGLMCKLFKADLISTTLSGYTAYTLDKNNEKPDFELLKNLVKIADCPIILEGRIWTPEHIKMAFNLGAYAVVVGSAITRPHLITQRFVNSSKERIND